MFIAFALMFLVAIVVAGLLYLSLSTVAASRPVATGGSGGNAIPAASVPMWFTIVLSVGNLLFGVGVVFFVLIARRHAKRVSVDADGYACPNCLYDLSSGPVDRCTECGQRVVYAALPTLWGVADAEGMSAGDLASTGFSRSGLSAFERRLSRSGFVVAMVWISSVVFADEVQEWLLGEDQRGFLALLIGYAPFVVVCAPICLVLVLRMQRLKRRVCESGGLSCPSCLEDLSGEPVMGCPACGQRVDYGSLAAAWAVRMKVLRIEPLVGECAGESGSESEIRA